MFEETMECSFSHFSQTGRKDESIVVVKCVDGKFYDLCTTKKKLVDVHPEIKPGCSLKVGYKGPREWEIIEVIPSPEPKEEPQSE